MRALSHIIVFRLYEDADPDEVLGRLRSLADEVGLLEWRVERSLDERKGIVLVQNSLFSCREDLERFRVAPRHTEVSRYMSTVADWWVADFEE